MAKTINSIFDELYKEFEGKYRYRLSEFDIRKSFVDGRIFKNLPQTRDNNINMSISKSTSGLYKPFGKAVMMMSSIISSGFVIDENVVTTEQIDAINLVKRWSEWNTKGLLYTNYGCMYGMSYLKVSEDIDNHRIVIEPIKPQNIMLIKKNNFSSSTALSIFVCRLEDNSEFAEVIDRDTIKYFLNGQPYGSDNDPSVSLNDFGFIPYIEVKAVDNGEELSETTFNEVIPAFLALNETLSNLSRTVVRNNEPPIVISGDNPNAADIKSLNKKVLYVGQNGDAKYLRLDADTVTVMAQADKFENMVQNGLPELIWEQIINDSNISSSTIMYKAKPLIIKNNRMRPNFDAGLVKSLRLVGQMAEVRGYPDLVCLKDLDDYAFDVNREVIPISESEKLDIQIKRNQVERDSALLNNEGYNPSVGK